MNQQQQYAYLITQALVGLFDEESENQQLDLETVDLTHFFIGLVKAAGLFYNDLTGDEKNQLEFTYLLNQLIVQDLLEKKGGKTNDE